MAKGKGKLSTPDWVLKGEKPPKKSKAAKTFRVRRCAKCNSDDVSVVVGKEAIGEWKFKTLVGMVS
ncbi:hypothetical protein ACFLZJ_01755 [Nanoarchaeota archaeon]